MDKIKLGWAFGLYNIDVAANEILKYQRIVPLPFRTNKTKWIIKNRDCHTKYKYIMYNYIRLNVYTIHILIQFKANPYLTY